MDSEDFPTISKLFDEQLKVYTQVENTNLSTASKEIQEKVSKCIETLEQLTLHVSELGVFSPNEYLEELTTNSIKFLMLPVLLGSLTLKLTGPPRLELLQIASIYFKDFIRRCHQYGFAKFEVPKDDDDIKEDEEECIEPKPPRRPMRNPTPEDLKAMSAEREEKIKRYKEKKDLSDKLKELKTAVENPSHDDEVVREYYITMAKQFVYQSFEELDSIAMEQNMLKQMSKMNLKDRVEIETAKTEAPSKPLRPFLIAKDDAQKKVFGAGYPSLPVMSVAELYDQRVKDGWWKANNGKKDRKQSDSTSTRIGRNLCSEEEQESGEEEDGEENRSIESLRHRDEWRDTHRAGWGNTHNKS